MAIALLLYFSLKKIMRDFREKDYGINTMELLFILTPAAELMIGMLLRINHSHAGGQRSPNDI